MQNLLSRPGLLCHCHAMSDIQRPGIVRSLIRTESVERFMIAQFDLLLSLLTSL